MDLPKNIKEFDIVVKFHICKMHERYKIRIETEYENRLAREIRDMYCQISSMKKNQPIMLSQTNGSLAFLAIGKTHFQPDTRIWKNDDTPTMCSDNNISKLNRNRMWIPTLLYLCNRKFYHRYGWLVYSLIFRLVLEIYLRKIEWKPLCVGT